MTTLQSNGYQIALIEVPEGATVGGLYPDNTFSTWNSDKVDVLNIPGDDWSILGPGLSTLCSEKDAKKVVEGNEEYKNVWIYKCYQTGKALHTALESLHSLIRSHSMKPETTVIIYKKL